MRRFGGLQSPGIQREPSHNGRMAQARRARWVKTLKPPWLWIRSVFTWLSGRTARTLARFMLLLSTCALALLGAWRTYPPDLTSGVSPLTVGLLLSLTAVWTLWAAELAKGAFMGDQPFDTGHSEVNDGLGVLMTLGSVAVVICLANLFCVAYLTGELDQSTGLVWWVAVFTVICLMMYLRGWHRHEFDLDMGPTSSAAVTAGAEVILIISVRWLSGGPIQFTQGAVVLLGAAVLLSVIEAAMPPAVSRRVSTK